MYIGWDSNYLLNKRQRRQEKQSLKLANIVLDWHYHNLIVYLTPYELEYLNISARLDFHLMPCYRGMEMPCIENDQSLLLCAGVSSGLETDHRASAARSQCCVSASSISISYLKITIIQWIYMQLHIFSGRIISYYLFNSFSF